MEVFVASRVYTEVRRVCKENLEIEGNVKFKHGKVKEINNVLKFVDISALCGCSVRNRSISYGR